MKRIVALTVVMILPLFAAVGAPKDASHPVVTWDTTMPSIELSHQPLEKVLNELKQKLPGFDFSVSRENVPHDYPVLPAMTLENVSLEQFMGLVSDQLPGVRITEQVTVEGGGFRDGFHQTQPATGIFCSVNIVPASKVIGAEPTVVRVFGLGDIIAYRASLIKGTGDHEKQATDDVLSLIQSALEESDSKFDPVLKIHPPTQTLICKVTEEQAKVVEQALKALQPTEAELRRVQQVEISNRDQPTTAATTRESQKP